jgi:hypothetical protein
MDKNIILMTLEPNVESHTAIDIAEDTLELLNSNSSLNQ